MQFAHLPGLAGCTYDTASAEALIAAYTARAREYANGAAMCTQFVTDLRMLVAGQSQSQPPANVEQKAPEKSPSTNAEQKAPEKSPPATRAEQKAPERSAPSSRHRNIALGCAAGSSAPVDGTAGNGYDPSADARSVAAMLRAKGGTQ